MRTALAVRRVVLGTLAAITLAVPALAVGAAPAVAAGSKDCASAPSKQIARTVKFGTEYTRWGWAEWRYGTSGSCKGYKWMNVHVTEHGVYINNWQITLDRWGYGSPVTKIWWKGVHHVGIGTWHSYAKYGYKVRVGAVSNSRSSKGSQVQYDDLIWFWA